MRFRERLADRRARLAALGRPYHQPGHRRACLLAQFCVGDLRSQSRLGEHVLHVALAVTVTAVQFQTVLDARPGPALPPPR